MALAVGVILGTAASGAGPLFEWFDRKEPPTLQDRIEVLTTSLNGAAEVIATIETEIEARRALVAELERKAQTAEALSEVNQQAIEAAAVVLRGELDRSARDGAWWDFFKNMLYIGLGIGMTKAFEWAWARRPKKEALPEA